MFNIILAAKIISLVLVKSDETCFAYFCFDYRYSFNSVGTVWTGGRYGQNDGPKSTTTEVASKQNTRMMAGSSLNKPLAPFSELGQMQHERELSVLLCTSPRPNRFWSLLQLQRWSINQFPSLFHFLTLSLSLTLYLSFPSFLYILHTLYLYASVCMCVCVLESEKMH